MVKTRPVPNKTINQLKVIQKQRENSASWRCRRCVWIDFNSRRILFDWWNIISNNWEEREDPVDEIRLDVNIFPFGGGFNEEVVDLERPPAFDLSC